MITYNNSVLKVGSSWLKTSLNPLGLPPYTMRFLFDAPFYDPTDYSYVPGTWTRVSTTPNIWDFTYSSTNWGRGTVAADTDVFEMQKLRHWWQYYDPVRNVLVQSQQNAYPWVHLLGFNSEGVTNMSHLFGYVSGGNYGCQGFADVCLFDTSSVTNFEYFMDSMTNISDLNNYDTHNATTLVYAFANTEDAHNAVRFDLSSCTDASYMFYGSGIASATLTNTGSVTSFENTFWHCANLASVNLFDTSAATTTQGMFSGCSSLTTVPLFDISHSADVRYMFNNCSHITSVPLLDTSSATTVSYMFYGCSALAAIPLIDTSSATSFVYMCHNCTSITEVPLLDTSAATNVGGMFDGCVNVETGALALYNQISSQSVQPQYHTDCFKNCGSNTTTGAAELAQIPTSWGGTMA